jgi:tetratricopeptide (TPR) repeat protein
LDVTALDNQAGVAPLEEALRAIRPGDDRVSRDRGAAERLAGICGGLPLALRIMAALLIADPALTVDELGDELANEVRRLEGLHSGNGNGTSVPSVAAAFELSYRRLDPAAAQLFRLLPVNPGPDVSTAAAAALAGRPVSETRRVLGQLARAHLVEAAGAAARWRLHDLLYPYARQLSDACADADGREQARDRLLDYYLTTAGAAADHLRALPGTPVPASFSGRDDALAWLDEARASLIPAVTLAANAGRDHIAMLLPLQLSNYLSWRRHFDDWLAAVSISRDAARRLGDRTNEAVALINLGAALVEVRRFEEAITANQDAAAIYRKTGDQRSEGMALNNLGAALREVRRFEEAINAHQDAAAIYRETGDQRSEGMALNNIGAALVEVDRFEEAISAHQDAAAIFRETGDQHSAGVALNNLGVVLVKVGRFEEAISAHQDAAAIFRETGDQHSEGMALDNLGGALRGMGRFEEAISAHQDAAAIFRETGDQHSEGRALNNIGNARFEEAISAHQDAAAIFREAGDQHSAGVALNNLERDRARRDVMAAGRISETDEPGLRNVSDPAGDMKGWQVADWTAERVGSDPLEDRPQRRRWRLAAAWAIGGLLAVSVVAGLAYRETVANSANVPIQSQGATQTSSPSASAKASRSASPSRGPSANASPPPNAFVTTNPPPASPPLSPSASASSSPSPTASRSASSSPSPSASASSSPSATASPSASASSSPSATASPSASSSPSATATTSPSATASPSAAKSSTTRASASPSPSAPSPSAPSPSAPSPPTPAA